MGRGRHVERAEPELALALRWLRHRAHLTQAAVAQSAGLSRSYYEQLEAGRRHPGPEARAALLAALRADEAELSALLVHRPWEQGEPGAPGYRVSRRTPRPADFGRAARAALAEAGAGETWSAPVEAAAAPEPSPLAGEVAELVDHYVHLRRRDQETLLAEARRRRRGAAGGGTRRG
jgi:transcriptional regulator with XRE-family HTH domain